MNNAIDINFRRKQQARAKGNIDPYSILGLTSQKDRSWQIATGKFKDNTIKS